jgi:hypothetical protein
MVMIRIYSFLLKDCQGQCISFIGVPPNHDSIGLIIIIIIISIIIKSLLNRKEAQQTCAFTIPIPIELNYNYND